MIETKVIRKLQDLTYLTWDKTRHSSGTAGSYLKSYEMENNKKLYYKLSCYDSLRGITGHECVNEIPLAQPLYPYLFGSCMISNQPFL